jgi:hypothetical protein
MARYKVNDALNALHYHFDSVLMISFILKTECSFRETEIHFRSPFIWNLKRRLITEYQDILYWSVFCWYYNSQRQHTACMSETVLYDTATFVRDN